VDLSTERGKLVVTSKNTGNSKSIPWQEINVILCGLKTNYHGGVLHQAAKFDVVLLFTNWQYIPVGGVYPMYPENAHNRVAARQIAQAELSIPRRKNAWMQIVKAKVRGQAKVLEELGEENGAGRLQKIALSVRSGDESNDEGQAAKIYWAKLFRGWRRDQEAEDVRNSCLNYAYTILRGHAIRAVLGAGLTPTLGLFHKNRANFFCLADDIMEPFRPVIDYAITELDLRHQMTSENKHKLVDAANQQFLKSGLTIPSVLNDLAQKLGKYVEGDEKILEVPVWEGPF
jgi:CRISPR-associated protein Cas1